MDYIGKRIRSLRVSQKRSLQEIADRCGFTKSLLSKIENGRTIPPISTLTKIANELGVKASALLDEEASVGETVYIPGEALQANDAVVTNKGYAFHVLAGKRPEKLMQPYLFFAGKGEIRGQALAHEGEEFIYMLEGTMKYTVGAVQYTLNPGDGLYFNSSEEHNLEPLTGQTKYLAVFCEDRGKAQD